MPDPSLLRRGKLPARPLKGIGTLRDYLTDELPPAPATAFDYGAGITFPMALNDSLGDCTIAAVVHLLQIAYAAVGRTFTYPGDDVVRTTYFDLTGGPDSGLVLTDVLQHWQSDGLFGTKIVGAAEIAAGDLDLKRQAVYAFAALYDGFALPEEAETEFSQTPPEWHLEPGPNPPVGGHCVVTSGDDPVAGTEQIITWGADIAATDNFCRFYQDECYVVFPEVFVDANRGPLSAVDLTTLEADWRGLS